MANKFTNEEFVDKSRQIHGDKYDYSKVEYVNNYTTVCIICPIHGEFWQKPKQHLSGCGCSKCKYNGDYKVSYIPLDGEIWKPIKGFEEFYQISNKGRLMSSFSGEWKLLSSINSKGDYLCVVLRKGDYRKSSRIHRLVYETFVGEIPKGHKYHIHHINGNKQDNKVENLVLHTAKEHNLIHSKKNPSKNDGLIFYNKYTKTKKIAQLDMDGNVLNIFPNGVEASRKTRVCSRNILQVANKEPYNSKGNIRKQAGGYIWKFVD